MARVGSNPNRKQVNTTLDSELYQWIQIQAIKENCFANDLLDEAMALLKKDREENKE